MTRVHSEARWASTRAKDDGARYVSLVMQLTRTTSVGLRELEREIETIERKYRDERDPAVFHHYLAGQRQGVQAYLRQLLG